MSFSPFSRLAAALSDRQGGDRAVAMLLVGYVALWTLYAVLAKGSQDIHFDMGELVAWAREPALGYPKHPPFSAWLVKAWFSLFPSADWAYYLLAMANAGLALWIAWVVSGRFLEAEKRAAGLALLTLVPFFNFHALKFNANAVLLPLWAATTWCFLRSFETRRVGWALLAGIAAGAAMLGKYWSIVLLIGLGLAAAADPRRAAYFRSPAPWVTIAAGALMVAPNLAWLAAHDFAPFAYAAGKTTASTALDSVLAALGFLGGTAGYVAGPVLLGLAVTRPGMAALPDTLWPKDPDRRFAAIAFWTPLWLPAVAALVAGGQIVSLWAMPALTLFPVVLLSSPHVTLTRDALARILAVAIALPVVLVLAAPIIAVVIHRAGLLHHAAHYRLLAGEIERAWRAASTQPLRLVGSYTNLVNGAVFYLSDRPSTVDVLEPTQTPWADAARIGREGIALACPVREEPCMQRVTALAAGNPAARRSEVEIARAHLGLAGQPERYLIIVIPPP